MELQQLKQLMAQLESAIEETIASDKQRAAAAGREQYMEDVYHELGEFQDRVLDLKREYRKQIFNH